MMKYTAILSVATLLLGLNVKMSAQKFEVDPISVNSSQSDFSPAFYGEGVVFCSNRAMETLWWNEDTVIQFYTDLYYTEPQGDWDHMLPILFSKAISTELNEGPAVFDEDRGLMYYTANVKPTQAAKRKQKNVDEYKLGIFIAEFDGAEWVFDSQFPYNDLTGEYNIAHPALSNDGNTLVFSSNMPCSYGGPDLFYCSRQSDGWSAPRNLGLEINTPGGELFPFLDFDNNLYFANDSRTTNMGMDIFMATPIDTGWVDPVRLPEPLNTSFDDFAFIIQENGMQGYLSSNRIDSIDNIFSFNFKVPEYVDCTPIHKPTLCHQYSASEILGMTETPLQFNWNLGDGNTAIGQTITHCYDDAGEYMVSLEVVDPLDNSVFLHLKDVRNFIERFDKPFITAADQENVKTAIDFGSSESDIRGFEVEEWIWDFGDGNKFKGASSSHTYEVPGIYEVRLMAIGKTDAEGHRSVASAYKSIEILPEGTELFTSIAPKALVQSNVDHDWSQVGRNDSIETHFHVMFAKSKERTAFNDSIFSKVSAEITEMLEEDSSFTYGVFAGMKFQDIYPEWRTLRDSAYVNLNIRSTELKKLNDLVVKKGSKIENGNVAQLSDEFQNLTDIKFKLNSDEIESESFDLLDYLVSIIKNESGFHLEIMAHSCNLGGSEYNFELSNRRAAAVVQYLSRAGIDESRMISCGFGDQQPMASNATELGRSQNRRVEFAIIFDEVEPQLNDQTYLQQEQ